MTQLEPPSNTSRTQRWPYFSTPILTFLAVMIPITALMLAISLLGGMPRALRWSAAGVVAISVHAFWRGYLHWLEVDDRQVRYRTLTRTITIAWSNVRRIDRYVPPDRNPSTPYIYITQGVLPPPDRFTLSDETVQLQDRSGLLELLQDYKLRCTEDNPSR